MPRAVSPEASGPVAGGPPGVGERQTRVDGRTPSVTASSSPSAAPRPQAHGVRTAREVLERALRELVDREEQRRLAQRLRGSGWDGSLD